MTTLEDYIKLADNVMPGLFSDRLFTEKSRTLGPAMAKALIEAEEALQWGIHQIGEGTFDNGVWDPTGTICEGEVNAGKCLSSMQKSLATIERLRNGGV